MATLNFTLKSNKRGDYISARFSGGRQWTGTNHTIIESTEGLSWNKRRQRFNNNANLGSEKNNKAKTKNKLLDTFESHVMKCVDELNDNPEVIMDKFWWNEEVINKFKVTKETVRNDAWMYYFKALLEEFQKTRKGKYQWMYKHMDENLPIRNITERWLAEYVRYREKKGSTKNSIDGIIRFFRGGLKFAIRNGVKGVDMNAVTVKISTGEKRSPEVEPFTEKEVRRLFNMDTDTLSRAMKDTLNVAIIGISTGLRISDILKVVNNLDVYTTEDSIAVVNKKTGKKSFIPVNTEVIRRARAVKYVVNFHTFNQNLKRLLKVDGGFDRKIETVVKGKTTVKLLYKYASSKLFRKTFVTLLLLKDVDNASVRNITKHSTEQAYLHYVGDAVSQKKSEEFRTNHLHKLDLFEKDRLKVV